MQIPNSDKPISIYSLDMIISVGYRVNSRQGVAFRRWATRILKEYMLRGFSINQHLISLQEHFDNRFSSLESRVENHEQKIDFLIQKEQPITKQLFSTDCVWDAYQTWIHSRRNIEKNLI